jgi:manganese/zinc/iron transport system permease protein
MLFAPRRGVLSRAMRVLKTARTVRRENLLRDLYELAEESTGENQRGATIEELLQKRRGTESAMHSALRELQQAKLVENGDGYWKLTDKGLRVAHETVRRHRLWEMYLMHETALGEHNAHRDADDVEHFLPPEIVAQLEELLREHQREPRLGYRV